MRWLLVLVACSSPVARAPAPKSDPARVVPERALAPQAQAAPPPELRLPRHFAPISHELELSLRDNALDGTMRITGDVITESPVIWLHAIDLAIYRVTATRDAETLELAVARQPKTETIALVPRQPFTVGRWTLAIEYRARVADHGEVPLGSYGRPEAASRGAFSQVVGGKRYTFTNFEPMDARRVFPCIDEPDRKVPWKLALDVPRDLLAVSNTAVARKLERGERTRYEFARTRPLPSYLIAFAIGSFEAVDAGVGKPNVPIRILVPRGSSGDARAIAKWMSIAFDSVASYVGLPYAYGKIDLVAVPRTGPNWSAMENPGLITFEAGFLKQPALLVHVMQHEFAHQWFGNSVTLAWWNDIWLNEAFATWLSTKLPIAGVPEGAPLNPERFADYAPPESAPTIRPTMRATANRDTLAPYMSGHESAELVRKLERLLGENVFRDALRSYLHDHADGVASSTELANTLSTAFGHPLTATLMAALDGKLSPRVAVRTHCRGKPSIEVTREGDIPVVACVAFDEAGKRVDRCVTVEDKPVSLPVRSCPRWLLPEPQRSNLVDYIFDKTDLRRVLDHGWAHLQPFEQAALLEYKWDDATDLEIATRLADSSDPVARDRAARWLLRFSYNLPDDLRPAFERRVRAQYTDAARARGLDANDDINPGALMLLASIGDPVLGPKAAERLRRPGHHQPWIYGFAVHADRARVDSLLESDTTPFMLYGMIGALPDALALVAAHAKLPAAKVHHILVARCTTQRRDAIQRMAELDDVIRRRALSALDTCLPTTKALEPIFRRWLAPKVSGSTLDERAR